MNRKKYISLVVILTILKVFSYGQSPVNLGTVCAESKEMYGVKGYAGSTFYWFPEGGTIDNNEGDTVTINWGRVTGDNFQLEVQEVYNHCTGVPSIGKVNIQAPLVDLGVDYREICAGDTVVLDARGDYNAPYTMQWQDGTFSPKYTATKTELIWVLVTDSLGCKRYDTVDFVSHPLPKVNLGSDTLLCDIQNPYELNAGDYPLYEWTTSSGSVYTGNPFYIYPVNGTIDSLTIKVTDLNGCSNSDTIVILPCDIASLFKDMPNTITPNGDNMNDEWIIPYIEEFPNAVLEIFDRWGRLVFHTDKVYDEHWDGTSNGRDMPMDVYYYVLDLNYLSVGQITGSLNLIR